MTATVDVPTGYEDKPFRLGDLPPVGLADEPPPPALEFLDARTLFARVDAAGPPQYLIRGLWPSDAYGVIAAEDKAGKTWAQLDAAVAVASGTKWLDKFAVDKPGPVLVFVGEGGERNIARRLRAVAECHGVDRDELPVTLCMRVPHLSSTTHLREVAAQLAAVPAVLVILDPLYLAARGANGSDLYAMGETLERLQHLCQKANAALSVVTHFNKTGEGKGARRITGVGPGAWGRVLATASVERKETDDDGTSDVVLAWEFAGGEIADTQHRVRRRVWADDPDDLGSPLHITWEALDAADEERDVLPTGKPSTVRVYEVLRAADRPLTVHDIGDALADSGRPLKARTIQAALKELGAQVDAVVIDARGTTQWTACEATR